MTLEVKEVVSYGGHSLSANGSVNLTLKAGYPELTNSICMMQMLNCDVDLTVKIPNNKAMRLGMFRIKGIDVHGDGCSVLKFNGLADFVEMDNLNNMPLADAEVKDFKMRAVAEVEEENEVEEDGE